MICKRRSFEWGIGKYSTRSRSKVPYSSDMCCIFQYRTNTVFIFSHDCPELSTAQISVQLTVMTDDHMTRRRSHYASHIIVETPLVSERNCITDD